MFQNYFKTAFRNLLRYPTLSFISIFGFSVGLGFVILITIFISNELSYDQFHSKKKKLYRITGIGTDDKGNVFKSGNTKALIAPLFTSEIAGIEQSCRIDGYTTLIKKNNDVISTNVTEVDSSFLDMFSFELLQGNKGTVLRSPGEAVITDEMALKVFGTLDALGKVIEIEKGSNFTSFKVTGIARKPPNNSTIFFDVLIPLHHSESLPSPERLASSWVNTFVLTSDARNIAAIEESLTKRYNDYTNNGQQAASLIRYAYHMQPITDMHLNEEFYVNTGLRNGSSKIYSHVLGGIAIFILLVACINFINLALVRAMKRSKEIGIRKVAGGTRAQLVYQFLTESMLIGIFALVPAIVIMVLLLPYLSAFVRMDISLALILNNLTIITIVVLALFTGLLAGAYPALVLSSFKPIQALAGKIKLTGKNLFNKGLIVFQFTLAVFLIICTLTMQQQFRYLSGRNLGYNTSDIMVVEVPRKTEKKVLPLLQQELQRLHGVRSTTITNWGMNRTKFTVDGNPTDWCYYQPVDEQFLGLFNIRLLEGRNFFAGGSADSSSCLVNQAFVRAIGTDNVIGKQIGYKERILTIVGVAADFHLASLKHEMAPAVLLRRDDSQFGQLYIQHEPGQFSNIRALVEADVKKLDPWHKAEIRQLSDVNADKYSDDRNWATVINFSSVVCIALCCLGLFALSSFNIVQRIKEIGIRKVLGANAGGIIVLMAKEFLKLVLIASIIAAPVGWWVMNGWLQNFAYRVDVQWWLFVAAAFIALTIAAVTIGLQTVKAAVGSPVKSMRE